MGICLSRASEARLLVRVAELEAALVKKDAEVQAAKNETALVKNETALAKNETALAKKDAELQAAKTALLHKEMAELRQGSTGESNDDRELFKRMAGSPIIRALQSNIFGVNPQLQNPWKIHAHSALAPTKATKRKKGMRLKASKFYRTPSSTKDGIVYATCSITGIQGDPSQVIAAHLLPRSATLQTRRQLGWESETTIDDSRNILLLANGIEKAFDNQRLCFLMTDHGNLALHVLDNALHEEPIYDGSEKMIGDYNNSVLFGYEGGPETNKRSWPFTRVLSLHAQFSFIEARKAGFVSVSATQPSEYGSPLKSESIRCLLESKMLECESLASQSATAAASKSATAAASSVFRLEQNSSGNDVPSVAGGVETCVSGLSFDDDYAIASPLLDDAQDDVPGDVVQTMGMF